MIVIDKNKDKKKNIASKMRIPSHLLAKFAHMGGKIGKAAASFDSWQQRHLDKDGVYKNWKKEYEETR